MQHICNSWDYASNSTWNTPIDNHISVSVEESDGKLIVKSVNVGNEKYFVSAQPQIKRVIFAPPATIVYWEDGTKTVVKCKKGEKFHEEDGLAFAIAKKVTGTRGAFEKLVEKAERPSLKK